MSNVELESRVARAVPLACAAIDPALPRDEQLRRIHEVLTILAHIGDE